MSSESPVRAKPDNRILDREVDQYQPNLFDDDSGMDAATAVREQDQLLADYRQRYGLAEDPFSNDFSFPFFAGAERRHILDQLLHLSQFSNSILLLLGDKGFGKTRTAHAFLDALNEEDRVSYLPLSHNYKQLVLLQALVEDLELPCAQPTEELALIGALEQFVMDPDALDEGLGIIVIDDAHLLRNETIALLLELLNKNQPQSRLHLVLVGEPELLDRIDTLETGSLPVKDFSLVALNLAETVDYLNFRMEMADYLGPEIFTESMVSAWWKQAQGRLDVIHGLAQGRLLESVTPQVEKSRHSLPVVHIVVVSLLLTIVAVLFLYMGDDEESPTTKTLVLPTASTQTTASSTAQTPPRLSSLPSLTLSPESAAPAVAVQQTQPSANTIDSNIAEPPIAPTNLDELVDSLPPVSDAMPTEPEQAQPADASESLTEETSIVEVKTLKPDNSNTKVAVTKVQTTSTSNHLSADEEDILSWPSSSYTIQILGVSQLKAAQEYIAAQSNKKDLLVFRSKRLGKDWFVVITGTFRSIAQARQHISDLPTAQRKAGPWPRQVGALQQEIKSAN